METVAPKPLSRTTTVQPAAVRYVQCKPVGARVPTRVQASLQISSPKDSAEREAEATARKITGMVVPENSVGVVKIGGHGVFRQVKPEEKDKKLQRSFESPYLMRFAASGIFAQKREEKPPRIQRKAEGEPNVSSNVAAEIRNSLSGGAPLPLGVRRFMEPRFRVDFSKVKVHTGDKAAKLNRQVSAQAFAVGNDVFFGKDKFQPDTRDGKELIAHELTHTIQQGASVQRSEEVNVTQQAPVQVQRLGVSDALDYFADHANLIPGFRMFTIILGVNPINMSSVSRSPANILRAMVEFIPGGALITQALDNYGIFDKIGTWVEQQVKTLGMVGSAIKQSVMDFIHSLSWTDIFDLGGVWDRAKRIFTEPIDRIKAFAVGLAAGIIQFIKDAILMPLAKLAEGTKGWDLLVAVLGKNPITGEEVKPTPDLLIGGFMKLIGQEEVWARIKQTNAIAKCWAWFKGAVKALMGFVQQIPALAIAAFKSLELVDIVLLPRAFMKVGAVFGDFLGNFFTWAGNAIWNLAEIIFDVVKPGALGYVKKTGAALKSILKNPLPFVGNLVKAAKLGFTNFAGNFLTHLKNGLLDWLTGSLPGVYIPKAISLLEVGKFALSVLGISWGQIRGKIVKALGPNGEKIMAGLELAFDVIKALVTGGPAAAWEVIKDKLTDLKDQVISGITSFIVDTIVQKAIPKLIAMFIPGAGFIAAIVSIYDTVMVFVDKISKIIQVVTAFIDSIVAIAGGAIGAAAARVESILGGLLSLAISFLAGFVGLGKVADKIMGVINKVRVSVDKALDAAIAWIVGKAKALFAKLFGKKEKKPDEASGVIGKAKQALAAGLTAPVKSKADVEAVTNSVYSQLKSEGLKKIRVTAAGPHLAVKISASPEETGAVFDQESTLDLSDLSTQFFAKTILVASIGGKHYKRESSGGTHAEEKLIADLNANWAKLENPTAIEIDINRAPCGPEMKNCAGRLANFANTKKVQLIVRAASPYPSDPSWVEAFKILKAEPNVDLKMWNVLGTLKSRYNIDPDDVKPDVRAKIDNRLKRLIEVRAEFYKIQNG